MSVAGIGVVKLIDLQTGKVIINLVSGPDGHWLKYSAQGQFWYSGSKRMIAAELLMQ